jgi:hypothetical protein
MRFLLGVIVGYSMRGEEKLLITVLATVAFIVYILLPAVALVALRLDAQHERQSRPAQTRVPAPRYDLPLQPGLIIDQTRQPGEKVNYGYPVGVTITKADSHGPGP